MRLRRSLIAAGLLAPAVCAWMAGQAPVASAGNAGKNVPLVSVPLSIHDDMPYLDVRVNDSAALWFAVDSGASACVIDTAQSRALGIPAEGEREGTGAGAGTYKLSYAKNLRYSVGNLSVTMDQSYIIDLGGVPKVADRKLDGLLGYDFFQRYIVVIDYDKAVMSLYDPKTYEYQGPGEALALTFKKKNPFVKGKIWVPGQPAAEREWLVDSGSGDTLNDDLLAQSTGEKKELTGGKGLGNEFQILQATANRVELGRFHFEKMSGFSGGMKIGGGMLRHFTVIFDFPGQRMILEPNRQYHE